MTEAFHSSPGIPPPRRCRGVVSAIFILNVLLAPVWVSDSRAGPRYMTEQQRQAQIRLWNAEKQRYDQGVQKLRNYGQRLRALKQQLLRQKQILQRRARHHHLSHAEIGRWNAQKQRYDQGVQKWRNYKKRLLAWKQKLVRQRQIL